MTADLMARLEAAVEGSRELDEAIADALGWMRGGEFWWKPPGGDYRMGAPGFTQSLDAALTLVPDGYSPNISGPVLHRPVWGCDMRLLRTNSFPDGLGRSAPTPALAVCISALKAQGIA